MDDLTKTVVGGSAVAIVIPSLWHLVLAAIIILAVYFVLRAMFGSLDSRIKNKTEQWAVKAEKKLQDKRDAAAAADAKKTETKKE